MAQLAESPEIAGQAKTAQNCLILLTGMRLPVSREPISPPGVGKLAQLGDRGCRTGLTVSEPALDVFLRPEEIHGASGEDNVVPPTGCGDKAVE